MNNAITPTAETIVDGLTNLLAKEIKQQEERTWEESYIGSNVREKLTQALSQFYRPARSFKHLRRIAVGLTDGELKKILVELNAQYFFKENGTEMWYLKKRTQEKNNFYKSSKLIEVAISAN